MKTVLRSVAMAFSMFSSVPMPGIQWKKENMRYMLAALPLVGVAIGAVLYLWTILCGLLSFGRILYAVGVTLLPLAVTGGIHMDGFCDTVDALSSHAAPERKREILKDPHAGAFAVIFAGVYLLAYVGLCTEMEMGWQSALFLGVLHVFARSIGALAGTVFPGSGNGGLLESFRDAAAKRSTIILVVWGVLCGVTMIWLSPVSGVVCLLGGLLCLVYLRYMSKKEFGGMSGDLAGFLITLSELVMLACYVCAERVVVLWF